MNKDTIVDFKLSLAIIDLFPVLFFNISVLLVATKFSSTLFFIGATICSVAGTTKVLWKLIVALYHKNIWLLFIQMRILMPIGFVLIAVSVTINQYWSILYHAFLTIPSMYFFIIGVLSMILMMICAFSLDNTKESNNWIEQIINTIAQISILIGILLL